jgi:hypothetical protein
LKKWANKGIIKCPVCGKTYEYCHGLIVTPYFRHKDKEKCDYLYSEPETEEHAKGKIALFEWVKKQKEVTNAVLEAWIPETKQRPDIMFEYNGNKWVIEFQCSPIATEQVERHKLYVTGGIRDLWICGIDNFGTGRKYMEKIMYGMFDYKHNKFTSIRDVINFGQLPFGNVYTKQCFDVPLTDLTFDNKFVLTDKAMVPYIEKDKKIQTEKELNERLKFQIHSLYKICETIPKWYEQVVHNCKITISEGKISSPYLVMMKFSSDITYPFILFIKRGIIDICETEEYKRKTVCKSSCRKSHTKWETATKFIKIGELLYSNDSELVSVIKSYFSTKLREGVINKYNRKGRY